MKREITLHYSALATISQAQFENFKPSYGITEKYIIEEGDDGIDRKAYIEDMKAFVNDQISADVNRCKAEYIKKMYENIRFYERNGKLYPSVTSILGIDTVWKIPEEELRQYGSRGTIVHRLSEEYFKTGKWAEPREFPELKENILIVEKGNKNLHWNQCGYEEFFKKFKFKIPNTEQEVYNDEHLFAGRADGFGEYEGKKTIIDIKTGSSLDTAKAFRQLSAYASCVEGIEQMVIIHLNPTNKCGYAKPIVSAGMKTYLAQFIKERQSFKKRFGV